MKKYIIITFICLCSLFSVLGCSNYTNILNPIHNPTPTSTSVPTLAPGAVNILPDIDFENDINGTNPFWTWWFVNPGSDTVIFGAQSNISGFSGNCLHFSSPYCGTQEWNEQIGFWNLPGPGHPYIIHLKTGKSYFVSLVVKSDRTGRIKPILQDPDEYTYFGGYEITTTTTLQKYTGFLTTGNGQYAHFCINLGNLNDGVIINDNVNFYFDSIELLEQ